MKIITGTYKGATKYAVSFPSGGRSGLFDTEGEARAYIEAWNKPAPQAKKLRDDVALSTGKIVRHSWGANGAQVASSDVEMTPHEWTEYCCIIAGVVHKPPVQDAPPLQVNTRTLKTSELTGVDLDYAVALCEGHSMRISMRPDGTYEIWMQAASDNIMRQGVFNPSVNWMHGGPIIERENMDVCHNGSDWFAALFNDTRSLQNLVFENGPTPLIAAMRCYVASKLGDKIELPHR